MITLRRFSSWVACAALAAPLAAMAGDGKNCVDKQAGQSAKDKVTTNAGDDANRVVKAEASQSVPAEQRK